MAMSDERKVKLTKWASQYLSNITKREELTGQLKGALLGDVSALESKIQMIDRVSTYMMQEIGTEDFELVVRIANQAKRLGYDISTVDLDSDNFLNFDENGILLNHEGKPEISERDLKDLEKETVGQVKNITAVEEFVSEFDDEFTLELTEDVNSYFETLMQDKSLELSGAHGEALDGYHAATDRVRLAVIEKYTADYAREFLENGYNADRSNKHRNFNQEKDMERYAAFLDAHEKLDAFAHQLTVREYLGLKIEREAQKFIYENGALYYPDRRGRKGSEFIRLNEGLQRKLGIDPSKPISQQEVESKMRTFAEIELTETFLEKIDNYDLYFGQFAEKDSKNNSFIFSSAMEELFDKAELKEIHRMYLANREAIIKDAQERAIASQELKKAQEEEARRKEEEERAAQEEKDKEETPETTEDENTEEMEEEQTDEAEEEEEKDNSDPEAEEEEVKDDSESENENEEESEAEEEETKPKDPKDPSAKPTKPEPTVEPTKPSGETKPSPYPGMKKYPKEFVYHDVASEIINKYIPKKLSHDTQIMVCEMILKDLAKDKKYNQKKIDKDLKKRPKMTREDKRREKALGKKTDLFKKIVAESELKTMRKHNPEKVPTEKEDGKFVAFIKDKAKAIEKLKDKFSKKDKDKENPEDEEEKNKDPEEKKGFKEKAKGLVSKIIDKFTKEKGDEPEKTGDAPEKEKLGDKIKSGLGKVVDKVAGKLAVELDGEALSEEISQGLAENEQAIIDQTRGVEIDRESVVKSEPESVEDVTVEEDVDFTHVVGPDGRMYEKDANGNPDLSKPIEFGDSFTSENEATDPYPTLKPEMEEEYKSVPDWIMGDDGKWYAEGENGEIDYSKPHDSFFNMPTVDELNADTNQSEGGEMDSDGNPVTPQTSENDGMGTDN